MPQMWKRRNRIMILRELVGLPALEDSCDSLLKLMNVGMAIKMWPREINAYYVEQ